MNDQDFVIGFEVLLRVAVIVAAVVLTYKNKMALMAVISFLFLVEVCVPIHRFVADVRDEIKFGTLWHLLTFSFTYLLLLLGAVFIRSAIASTKMEIGQSCS